MSAVVITVHGSCGLGCIYSMDCLVGVSHMLVFPVMQVCCAFVHLNNKLNKMHGMFFKIVAFVIYFTHFKKLGSCVDKFSVELMAIVVSSICII